MTVKRRTVMITLSAIAGLSCYGIITWDASAMSDVISWVKNDSSQNDADEIQKKVESKTRKIEADEIDKKPMLELSRKEVAELEEVKKKGVEEAIAFLEKQGNPKDAEKLRGLVEAGKIDDAWDLAIPHIVAEYEELQATKKRLVEELEARSLAREERRVVEKVIQMFDSVGETKNAEKLRGLLEAGKISDAVDVATQQLLVWEEKRPDLWSRSELSSENRAAMMDKARVFGVSFATVVAYEMARARVPTSKILKTMETYDSLDESLLLQIDRINKHVDDQHFHYRLWKLSSGIDDVLSEKTTGR